MAIDARNNGNITGGIVSDPEIVNDGKIARFRIGVDYAGNDRKNKDNKSGYFSVTYFLDDSTPNAKFVKRMLDEGKMKKGSQVAILYRLVEDRWEKDGNNRSQVGLIAEAMSFAGSGSGASGDGGTQGAASAAPAQQQVAVPTEF